VKKTISFIINPISGGKNKKHIPKLIKSTIDAEKYEIDIEITSSEEDTLIKASSAAENKFDAVVAIGGDGTLNNVARYINHSEIVLGIVPMGSGNGFARELGISMDVRKSLQTINDWNIKSCDTGIVNDTFFINLMGVGFDAHVTGLFASSQTRGLSTYAKITLGEFMNYNYHSYSVLLDGVQVDHSAFLLSVCNGTQFGNNAYIAPKATMDDGSFDVSVVEKFALWQTPEIGLRLFNKSIDKMNFVKSYKAKEIVIAREKDDMVNIDGEPVMMGKELKIRNQPKSIKVIVPNEQ
jgi:YegS/Rv2252/BmrU family lipid kinase